MKIEHTKSRIKVIAASEANTKIGKIVAQQKLNYLKSLEKVRYDIFCKSEQTWHEYDLTDYECDKSGTGAVLFLRCHWCNDYWIDVSHEGVSDGFRYPDTLSKKQKQGVPLFRIFVTKDESLK